jgi:hypothetical protein
MYTVLLQSQPPWSGLVFSVTTNIHPTHLGLGPDPLDGPFFGLGLGGEGVPSLNNKFNSPSNEWEEAPAPGFLDYIAARGRDLAAKLGYIRSPPNPVGGGVGQGFQCMKSLDEPVLVDGAPVLVPQPEDCYQGRFGSP